MEAALCAWAGHLQGEALLIHSFGLHGSPINKASLSCICSSCVSHVSMYANAERAHSSPEPAQPEASGLEQKPAEWCAIRGAPAWRPGGRFTPHTQWGVLPWAFLVPDPHPETSHLPSSLMSLNKEAAILTIPDLGRQRHKTPPGPTPEHMAGQLFSVTLGGGIWTLWRAGMLAEGVGPPTLAQVDLDTP